MYVCSSLYCFQVETSQCTQGPEVHLKLSWNIKMLQMFCQSLFTYLSKTPLEFLACDRLSNQTQHCVVLVWGKPASRVVGYTCLTSVRKQGRKGGKMENKWYGSLLQFLQACVLFSRNTDFYHKSKRLHQCHSSQRDFDNSTGVDNASPLLHRTATEGLCSQSANVAPA